MFGLAALIPSPPVLVPELCGGRAAADDAHLAARVPALREAVLSAVRELAGVTSRWTVVGVCENPGTAAEEESGTETKAARRGAREGEGPVSGTGSAGISGRSRGDASSFGAAAADSQSGVSQSGVPRMGGSPGEPLFYGAGTVGTFRGYGADVRVALSEAALRGDEPADPGLPLPVLLGGWARGRAGGEVSAVARLVEIDAASQRCAEFGEALRRELDAESEPSGVLVIADGAATLSTGAPGYLDARAQAVQDRIDDALAAGDRAALAALDPALCAELAVSGRAAYQVLAGLFSGAAPKVETRYRAAPFGVGYQVSTWRPGAGS